MEKIILQVSEGDKGVAYLYLPDHPKNLIPGLSKKQISLGSLINGYKGPAVFLDFNSDDVLIGIEIAG